MIDDTNSSLVFYPSNKTISIGDNNTNGINIATGGAAFATNTINIGNSNSLVNVPGLTTSSKTKLLTPNYAEEYWPDEAPFTIANATTPTSKIGIWMYNDAKAVIQASRVGVGALPLTLNGVGGNVGIGTTEPLFTLDVSGTMNVTGNTKMNGSLEVQYKNPSYYSYTSEEGDLTVTSGAELSDASIYFRNPYQSSSQAKKAIIAQGGGWSGVYGGLHFCLNNITDQTTKVTTADSKMTILSGGNVGIGTITPDVTLDVSGNTNIGDVGLRYGTPSYTTFNVNGTTTMFGPSQDVLRIKPTLTATNDVNKGGIGFYSTLGDATNYYEVRTADIWTGCAGWASSYLAFGTSVKGFGISTPCSEQMRLTYDGRLGIGTTTPLYTLDVSGTMRFTSSTDNGLKISPIGNTGTTSQRGNITMYSTFEAYSDQAPRRTCDIYSGFTGTWGAEYMALGVGIGTTNDGIGTPTTERMRITGAGNVGIGTTTPTYKLDLNGTARIAETIGVGAAVTTNFIANGGNYNVDGPTFSNGEFVATMITGNQMNLSIPYAFRKNTTINIRITCRSNQPDMYFAIQSFDSPFEWLYTSPTLKTTSTTYDFTITNSTRGVAGLILVAYSNTSSTSKQFIYSKFLLLPTTGETYTHSDGYSLDVRNRTRIVANAPGSVCNSLLGGGGHDWQNKAPFRIEDTEYNWYNNTDASNKFYLGVAIKMGIFRDTGAGYIQVENPNTAARNLVMQTTSYPKANVGIGTETPEYKLDVNGTSRLGDYVISSDRRIKTSIKEFDSTTALNIFRKFQTKTYQYKNKPKIQYGFVAQEIDEIFPAAVDKITDFVYNIYTTCPVSGDRITVDTSLLEYDASGQPFPKLKLADSQVKILKIIDPYTIQIDKTLDKSEVFVFGQEVDNFHTLYKDTLWTVAAAALQEVDKQVQDEKEKNKTLHKEVETLKENNQFIQSKYDSMESKYDSLESKYETVVSKYDSMESKYDSLESKYETVVSKYEQLLQRILALEAK